MGFLAPKDCKPDKEYTANGVLVKQFFITGHNFNNISMPQKRIGDVLGVTLHNTDDLPNIEDDGRNYTASTVNGNMKDVRIHFYVDDICAWQNLPLDYQSWHAGQKGMPDAFGSGDGNAKTISIECIMTGKGTAEDRKAEDNAAKLCAYLLDKFNLNIDNLYTHNYWCNKRKGIKGTTDDLNLRNDNYKNCPVFIRPHWIAFKETVQGYTKAYSKVKELLYVQVGAFSKKENANAMLKEVRQKYPDAFIKSKDNMFYVQVGAYSAPSNAYACLTKVKKDYPNAFIKRFDK